MNFLEKLRNLPEPWKIAIFFVVLGIAALISGFLFVRSAARTIDEAGKSASSIQLPSIEFPNIDFPDISDEHVSPSDQPVLNTNQ